MAMGMPYGLQAMLKEGHKTFSGVEEAVMKNIDACKGLAAITRTSLGPNGGWGVGREGPHPPRRGAPPIGAPARVARPGRGPSDLAPSPPPPPAPRPQA